MLNTSAIASEFVHRRRLIQFSFPFVLLMSAALQLVIQPMVAKILLPIFGGTPAVWTVCMLFFQSMLLLSYSYAWALSRLKTTFLWRVIHLILCFASLYALPLHIVPELVSTNDPAFLILKTLLLQLGLPLLIVGASAPLFQYAFSQTSASKASDPYYLYAASNIGSLAALLSYPWVIERVMSVSEQFQLWNSVYVAYLVVISVLMFTVRYQPVVVTERVSSKLSWKTKGEWILLSFIPCSLMLGVTFYMSTDVAATPLLWVIPFALYLLSYIITFSANPWIKLSWVIRYTPIVLLFPIIGFIFGINQIPAWQLILMNLSAFFMSSLLCHGTLVLKRPGSEQLTSFYVCLAIGGMFAGVFNGLIAPRLFSDAYEYPLVFLAAIYVLPIKPFLVAVSRKMALLWVMLILLCVCVLNRYYQWFLFINSYHVLEVIIVLMTLFFSGSKKNRLIGMGALFAIIFLPWFDPTYTIHQERNFYGVKRVFSKNNVHYLMNQTTLHGYQIQEKFQKTNGSIAYYGPLVPVIHELESMYHPLHATILGLGAGTLLCQFQSQDSVDIIEIDNQVIDIASNPALFTNVRDCPAKVHVIASDGRLAMANASNSSNTLLIMDAFSSDAVPVHLLTLEAFSLYQKKIIPDGVILINASNRHLNILPVITAAAHQLNMLMLYKYDGGNAHLGQLLSQWALLTTNESIAASLMLTDGWRFMSARDSVLWTDDYSNIISLLKINYGR